ncbi:MAG: hypothetical protein K6T99_00825 [Armatimonadetes bacterium]|nr:hypothetical protein [Armatimonadota bacterium]
MAQFLIKISYTPDMFLHTLDEMKEKTPELLGRTYWGNMDGEYAGWLMVDADNEQEARDMLPIVLRNEAQIAEVRKYNIYDIERLHAMVA